jgi:hypothetical protein
LGIPTKIIPWKTKQTKQMVCSAGIPDVPRNRKLWKSVPNHTTEEKNAWNSVSWKKFKQTLRIPF